jgi:redox-sensing transcriptional repressor
VTVQNGERGGHRAREIPEATVERLAGYLRVLTAWQSPATISSEDLAGAVGVNPAKVRRDLSYLGSHGTRGVGYDVDVLTAEITRVLGAHQSHRVALVGLGNLGQALAGFSGFRGRGFELSALFDADPAKIGRRVVDLTIEPVADLLQSCTGRGVTIGVIATPRDAAQQVADVLVAAGVRSILNFAPAVLDVPPGVEVRRVDLGLELAMLAFHEARRDADSTALTMNRGNTS